MSFLAPLYLLLAAGIAVPLLVHLLRRRMGTRVRFPATRYLARAERDHSRTLKLRNLVLMALRVALIAALALAASRPAARFIVGAGSHGQTAVAIVLDNSLSSAAIVAGHPVLDSLRAVARQVVASASATDRLWLVTADGTVHGGSPQVITRELQNAQPLAGAGNPAAALARAAALVQSSGLGARTVVVITDGQRTAWERATPAVSGAEMVLWQPGSAAPANSAVIEARAQPTRWTPRGAVVARFDVGVGDSASYRMTLGGRTVARGTASAGPEVGVTAAPAERGWVGGTVQLEPDELPADNTRFFAVWIGAATGVAALPGAGPFVSNALDVLRGAGRVTAGTDVTIASADELERLPALVVAPADPSRVGVANRALQRLDVPWRFGPAHRDSALAKGGGGSIGSALGDVIVTLRYELRPAADAPADTLATVGAQPWVVAGQHYVIVASPLTADATTLPVSASFLPWLTDVLTQRLSGDPGQVLYAAPGEEIAAPRWADAIEGSDGTRSPLDATHSMTAPPTRGVFFLDHGGRRVGALVVNSPPEESLLQRFSAGELATRISRGRPAVVAPKAADVARDAFASGGRRPLAPLFLAAALALVVAEAWITGGWRRPAGARA